MKTSPTLTTIFDSRKWPKFLIGAGLTVGGHHNHLELKDHISPESRYKKCQLLCDVKWMVIIHQPKLQQHQPMQEGHQSQEQDLASGKGALVRVVKSQHKQRWWVAMYRDTDVLLEVRVSFDSDSVLNWSKMWGSYEVKHKKMDAIRLC